METSGLLVVAAVLVLGTVAGLWRRHTDGRLRTVTGFALATASPAESVAASGLLAQAGPHGRADAGRTDAGTGHADAGRADADVGRANAGHANAGRADADAAPADADASTLPDADRADAGQANAHAGRATAGVDPSMAGQIIDPALLRELGVQAAPATLLQFSSAFCAPCRAVRRVSAEVVALLPQVQHVEVDAESHLEAVRALGIWRTPTLLVLDADGRVSKRATGVPGKPHLIAALGDLLPAVPGHQPG